MREPTENAQGKYWITRIPTTLTILQDKSTGLAVDQPLPIFPEADVDNCENPLEYHLLPLLFFFHQSSSCCAT